MLFVTTCLLNIGLQSSCNQQLRIPCKLVLCTRIFLCPERMDRTTDRLHEFHVYIGLAQTHPKYLRKVYIFVRCTIKIIKLIKFLVMVQI